MKMTEPEFQSRLREVGEERYHHKHPFHLLMHDGKLTKGQLQAWALNRYYYQSVIPIKDSIILSRSSDPEFRRSWRKRIIDHDGQSGEAGGIEKWIQLAQATGLDRKVVESCKEILPGVRFAVDAYINLVSTKSMIEAVASSLTELFSKDLITLRVGHLNQHYPWLKKGLSYFEGRMTQAPEDASFAVKWVFENAKTREEQELAVGALRQKCDILWAQLDSIYYSYVNPGFTPPGAFKIKETP